MKSDTALRSLVKAVSWRIVGSLTTMLVVFVFTRRVDISLSVGVVDTLLKITLYFAHERGWNSLRWGTAAIEPFVVWFTGLSGSGKSTMAEGVYAALKQRGLQVEYLDGDLIRSIFPETGFTKADRDMHIRRVGHLAGMLEKNGVCVVASLISSYESSRRFARSRCRNFVEVHVATPLEVCEKRDSKGHYASARRGERPRFTGIDDPYEPPENCEIRVNTADLSKEEALSRVMDYLGRRHLDRRR